VVKFAWEDITFFISGLRHYIGERFPFLVSPTFAEICHQEIQHAVFTQLGDLVPHLAAVLRAEEDVRFSVSILRTAKRTSLLDMGVKSKHHLCRPSSPGPQRQESVRNYSRAIAAFREIKATPVPCQKLAHLVRTSKAIVESVREFYISEGIPSADLSKMTQVASDDLVPIFAFVLSEALDDPTNVHAEVEIMDHFILEHLMNGEEGYCLATLHSAIHHMQYEIISCTRSNGCHDI
jgi:hypothetical protein